MIKLNFFEITQDFFLIVKTEEDSKDLGKPDVAWKAFHTLEF